MKNQAFIVHGIKKNTNAGKITDGMIFTWEPVDGDTDECSVSEMVYLHN